MSTILVNKLNHLFDVKHFAELLKEGDDQKIDRELHLAVAEFNLHSSRVEFGHNPSSVCVRLFAMLVGHLDLTKALQHLYLRYHMNADFPLYDMRPPFPDAVTCAALHNNVEMIRFLFQNGAVLQHLPGGTSVLRNILNDRRNTISIEVFRMLVERMVISPAIPETIKADASVCKLSLSTERIQVLMQQGAEFATWDMSLWADSRETFCWMIQSKYIDITANSTMLHLLNKYVAGNDHRPYLLDIIHEILRHVTMLSISNEKEKTLLADILELCQICGTTEESMDQGFNIMYHLIFNIIGIKNLSTLAINGYPILIYCASKGYERLCKTMVEMGLNKKIFKSNLLFNIDSGESVARAAGFKDLADWFAEPIIKPVEMLPVASSNVTAIVYKGVATTTSVIDAID